MSRELEDALKLGLQFERLKKAKGTAQICLAFTFIWSSLLAAYIWALLDTEKGQNPDFWILFIFSFLIIAFPSMIIVGIRHPELAEGDG